MTQGALSTALQGMVPVGDEAAAIVNLVSAYSAYATDATALTPILAAGVLLGESSMAAALVGMSGSGQGATKFKEGVEAFWVAVAGGLSTSFAGASAISPPTFGSLDIQAVFDDNASLDRSLVDSADALATELHSGKTNGTVTTAGPIVTAIT